MGIGDSTYSSFSRSTSILSENYPMGIGDSIYITKAFLSLYLVGRLPNGDWRLRAVWRAFLSFISSEDYPIGIGDRDKGNHNNR